MGFVSITESIDTNTPLGSAVFTILGAVAQLERDLIAERVRNGLANARAKGVRIGRLKTRDSDLIRKLRASGMTYRQISKIANCSAGSVSCEIREMKKEGLAIKVAPPPSAEKIEKPQEEPKIEIELDWN